MEHSGWDIAREASLNDPILAGVLAEYDKAHALLIEMYNDEQDCMDDPEIEDYIPNSEHLYCYAHGQEEPCTYGKVKEFLQQNS